MGWWKTILLQGKHFCEIEILLKSARIFTRSPQLNIQTLLYSLIFFCCFRLELNCKLWKVNWSTRYETWPDKKKSESPARIEPMTSWTPDRGSIHWATITYGVQPCSKVMSCLWVNFSHFFTELRVHHLYSLMNCKL